LTYEIASNNDPTDGFLGMEFGFLAHRPGKGKNTILLWKYNEPHINGSSSSSSTCDTIQLRMPDLLNSLLSSYHGPCRPRTSQLNAITPLPPLVFSVEDVPCQGLPEDQTSKSYGYVDDGGLVETRNSHYLRDLAPFLIRK
jgi:hypothetical protein